MTREGLIEAMARALCVDDGVDPDVVGYDRTGRDFPNWYVVQGTAETVLAAIEAAGVRLVVASCELEFARMADGTVKVGYNPRTEEGGWTLVGDVTKSVTAIEAQRDQALRDLDIANQRLSNVFAALAASPYAPAQKDDSHE